MPTASLTVLSQMLGLLFWVGFWAYPVQSGSPQVPPKSQRLKRTRPSSPPKRQRPKANPFKTAFRVFLKRVESDLGSLGSRTGNLCVLAPGPLGETDTIWSDRPLFLWRGEVDQIILRHHETDEVLWQQAVLPAARQLSNISEVRQLSYDGIALQPGQVYAWELLNAAKLQRQFTFAVMPQPERLQLIAQLPTLSLLNQASGTEVGRGTDRSQMLDAMEQADYFGQQGLWSDALQVLYRTQNPPLEMMQTSEAIEAYLCDGTPIPENQFEDVASPL